MSTNTPAVELLFVNQAYWSGRDGPQYATEGSIGFDLEAAIDEPITLAPGSTELILTGLAFSINHPDIGLFLHPRSGLGNKGIVLGNLTGLIDSDYQGEIKVSLWNRTFGKNFIIQPGDRIAQAVFLPIIKPTFTIVNAFSTQTERGAGGFGSTGK